MVCTHNFSVQFNSARNECDAQCALVVFSRKRVNRVPRGNAVQHAKFFYVFEAVGNTNLVYFGVTFVFVSEITAFCGATDSCIRDFLHIHFLMKGYCRICPLTYGNSRSKIPRAQFVDGYWRTILLSCLGMHDHAINSEVWYTIIGSNFTSLFLFLRECLIHTCVTYSESSVRARARVCVCPHETGCHPFHRRRFDRFTVSAVFHLDFDCIFFSNQKTPI